MGVTFLGEVPLDLDVVKLCDEGKAFIVFKKSSNISLHFEKIAAIIEKYSQTRRKQN